MVRSDPIVLMAQQPSYLPWVGFLDRARLADVLVLQDDLKYTKQDWQNRNRIRTADGWRWLTIPVHANSASRICEVRPAHAGWAAAHKRVLENAYSRTQVPDRLAAIQEAIMEVQVESLAQINEHLLRLILRLTGVSIRIVRQSELRLSRAEQRTPTERLLALCRRLECNAYLSGPLGHTYIDLELWDKSRAELRWQSFTQTPYRQLFDGWVPGLSAVDMLMCAREPSTAWWH